MCGHHKIVLCWAYSVGCLSAFVTANFGREVALLNSTLGDALKIVPVVVVMIRCWAAVVAVVADAV